MKSWKTRLLVVFTMVTMMLAGSAPATAQVWVPCLAWWQDPITWQWWCLTPSGWAPVPVAAATAPAPVEERAARVDEADLRDLINLLEEEIEEEDEDEDEDEDENNDDNNDGNDLDVLD